MSEPREPLAPRCSMLPNRETYRDALALSWRSKLRTIDESIRQLESLKRDLTALREAHNQRTFATMLLQVTKTINDLVQDLIGIVPGSAPRGVIAVLSAIQVATSDADEIVKDTIKNAASELAAKVSPYTRIISAGANAIENTANTMSAMEAAGEANQSYLNAIAQIERQVSAFRAQAADLQTKTWDDSLAKILAKHAAAERMCR